MLYRPYSHCYSTIYPKEFEVGLIARPDNMSSSSSDYETCIGLPPTIDSITEDSNYPSSPLSCESFPQTLR